MKNEMLEIKNIRIITLSPLHIGDGTEFDPTSFWIDDIKNELIEFEFSELFEKLGENHKKQFLQGDISSLTFLKTLFYDIKPKGFRKTAVSSAISSEYNALQDNNEINSFRIKRTIATPNYIPYIPGSSLKGSLRTGLLHCLSSNTNSKFIKSDGSDLLGSFERSLFSALKVSDFAAINDVKTSINYIARVYKKNAQTRLGRFTRLESINSGSIFEGPLSLRLDMNTKIPAKNIAVFLEAADIYSESIVKGKPYQNSVLPDRIDINAIREIKKDFKNKTYLCRLGGFIGAESHTIDGNRKILIRHSNGNQELNQQQTSMDMFSSPAKEKHSENNTTFGWCLIEVLENQNEPLPQSVSLKDFIDKQNQIMNAQNNSQPQNRYSGSRQNTYGNRNNTQYGGGSNTSPKNKAKDGEIYDGEISRTTKKGGFMVKVFDKEYCMNFQADLKIGDKVKVKIKCANCEFVGKL